MEIKKEIGDKLIKSMQLENETLKNEIASLTKVNEEQMKEHVAEIEVLRNENLLIQKKNSDLIDENEVKRIHILDLEEFMEKKVSSSSSQSSLSEELQQAQLFQCENCDCTFVTSDELRRHMQSVHDNLMKTSLLNKIIYIEKNVLKQKINLTSSIFDLNKQETESSQKCNCRIKPRSFCKINHQKYNFFKLESNRLHSDFKTILNEFTKCEESTEDPANMDNILDTTIEESNEQPATLDNISNGTIQKKYSCSQCEQDFCKQGSLKKHMKFEHPVKRQEIGEV